MNKRKFPKHGYYAKPKLNFHIEINDEKLNVVKFMTSKPS